MKKVNLSTGENSSLFNNIAIEIASKCNRRCYFCPNGYNEQEDVYMDESLIIKVLNELKTLNYKGRVEWYIYNEPTRDKRLIRFISICKQMLPSCCQMINTNGDYFKSASDIDALFIAGLNQMQINIYSSSDDNEDDNIFNNGVRLAGNRMATVKEWVDSLSHIRQDISLYQHIGKKKAVKVIKKYGVRKEIKNTEVDGVNHFSNRSGNVPDFRGGLMEPLAKHCTRPFRFLNINYKGDSILCCNDYHGVTNFGNIATHSLVEIWNHPMLQLYRIKLKGKNRNCLLCNLCDYSGGYYPHMTDTITTGNQQTDIEIINNYLG